jgi:heptosyltransferase III
MLKRNVLIFHSGGLGDFVLTWPLGVVLGRLYPASRIIYITHDSKGALAREAIGLDYLSMETGWPALYVPDAAGLQEACAEKLRNAHLIVSFGIHPSWGANVRRHAPEGTVIELPMPPPADYAEHASQHILARFCAAKDSPTALAIGAALKQILLSLEHTPICRGRSAASNGPITIHPGSGGKTKCWPVGNFIRLIERLKSDGKSVKVILGEVELERLAGAEIRQLESITPVVRPADYLALLRELAGSAVFVGNDSGPAHLAGATGLSTLVLFGPSDPAVWRPLGPKVRTLRKLNLPELSVDEVYSAVLQL